MLARAGSSGRKRTIADRVDESKGCKRDATTFGEIAKGQPDEVGVTVDDAVGVVIPGYSLIDGFGFRKARDDGER